MTLRRFIVMKMGRLRLNRQKRIELTSPGASLPAGMHRSYRFLRCYCCPHSRFDSSRETLVCFRRLQSFGTCQAPKYVAFLENEKIFCWVIFECAMAPPASRPPAGCRASTGAMARSEMVSHIGHLKSALQESLPSVGSECIARSPLLAADDVALSAARRPPRECARLELDDRIPAA
jgi:hypothetical protein